MNARTLKILVPTGALAVAGVVGLWTAASAPAAETKPRPAVTESAPGTPSKTAPVPEPAIPRPGPSYQCVTCGWGPSAAG